MFTVKKKVELLSEIEEGFPDKEVYIPRIVGMEISSALLEYGENLRTIVVPPSVYAQTSGRVKRYLKDKKVSLEKGDERAGRPPKYTDNDVKEIIHMKNQGIPIAQISRELHIPRRTIYYLLGKK